jgi:hypothetical protein
MDLRGTATQHSFKARALGSTLPVHSQPQLRRGDQFGAPIAARRPSSRLLQWQQARTPWEARGGRRRRRNGRLAPRHTRGGRQRAFLDGQRSIATSTVVNHDELVGAGPAPLALGTLAQGTLTLTTLCTRPLVGLEAFAGGSPLAAVRAATIVRLQPLEPTPAMASGADHQHPREAEAEHEQQGPSHRAMRSPLPSCAVEGSHAGN